MLDFSQRLRELGDDVTAEVAADYRKLVRESVEAHGGTTIEAAADNVFAVFESARDAIECAASTRALLRQRTWPTGEALITCFAVHTGRLVSKEHGGASVLHLILLLKESEPWQILVSHSTEALLEGERLDPLELRDLGERHLPRLGASHRLFELVG